MYIKYLYYVINSKYEELNKYGVGSTFKAITKDVLYNLEIKEIYEEERKEVM